MRPPQLIVLCLNLVGLVAVPVSLAALVRNALGRLSSDEADYVPADEGGHALRAARVHMAVYAAIIATSVATGSILPAMLVGLPRAYGVWLLLIMGLPQHMGLADDVLDHRLNSRTVLMNRVLRFSYWNMNYHVEHHMYALVPYHALPRLHALVQHDCPPPEPSLWYAWRRIIPTVLRQLKEPAHFLRKELPPGAGRMAQPAVLPN